ncbi:Sulfite oxidase, Mitochondrial SUOX [Chondrus crispus]|uniref:sulfite oxidase n=1 Tax=Chondrus crispus TaxID=2769 RepID=R7QBG6_CHOCR|nr:Sulfite oxidase, Mitochondrial SUOX [Chondrus crispus]CDF35113.1 Sulfite oxidase, Mitochondrial SUOX [Chondrus crispus]|eukprot:XP_005714932.1 Sulfite oxidase, Mitochondrial SUOX [Chondrus crispus]
MFRFTSSRLLRPALALTATVTTAGLVHRTASKPQSQRNSFNDALWNTTIHPLPAASEASQFSEPSADRAGLEIPEFPSFKASEVRSHDGKKGDRSVWVGYGRGVYDVTEFAASHPGGDQILRAAGGPLEPHWRLYAQHNAEWVLEILEELRIGNLMPDEEWIQEAEDINEEAGPYAEEPIRSPKLIVQGEAPFNAEPELKLLVHDQLTPNDLFYVRNHMPVPVIHPEEYRLEVVDTNGKMLVSLSLEDLKKLPKHVVAATIQCAGNRRNELDAVKKVKGGRWEGGAISNAEWGGARLADVLALSPSSAKTIEISEAHHLCFEGLDTDPGTGAVYAASIPVDVLHRVPDVLLAYEMNGETLPRDHGYPVRAVVPGIVGARCVKWLGRVVLSKEESTSHWQRQDYRSFSPGVDWDTVDFTKAPSIQEMPVVSSICDHSLDGEKKTISMSGYAWSGDGKGIIRVDVSADGGKTWQEAALRKKGSQKRNETYDWTLWDATIKAPANGKTELVCKAVDSAYNTQPERAESIWNLRGLLNNAWHRVDVDKV